MSRGTGMPDWDTEDPTADRIRGFPAFGRGQSAGRRFARNWWGKAWVRALEETSLDQGILRRGRKFAHSGHVGSITVSPGRIAAIVHSSTGDSAYQTVVYVQQLSDDDWDRFLDRIAAKSGHLAALLERDMPHDLADAAEDADIPLLPALGDLDPECDCPDWELPCEHAAALAYQASWLLDADPFILLLLRGRGERELLAELQRLNAPAVSRTRAADALDMLTAAPEEVGTPAAQAYARVLPAFPPLPPDPPHPLDAGHILDLPAAPGVEPERLRALVAHASIRAHTLLSDIEREN